jgi:hypothetical protein
MTIIDKKTDRLILLIKAFKQACDWDKTIGSVETGFMVEQTHQAVLEYEHDNKVWIDYKRVEAAV